MADKEEDHQVPVCPSCGEPYTLSLLDKVKFNFFTLLLGYLSLSMFLFMMSVPAELRRYQTHPPLPWDTWLQPLSNKPIFQIFVGGGLVIGVLILYWSWLQNIYKSWQMKRETSIKKHEEAYKYKCRSCGRQWN